MIRAPVSPRFEVQVALRRAICIGFFRLHSSLMAPYVFDSTQKKRWASGKNESRWAPKKTREFESLRTPIPNCGRLYFLRRCLPFAPHARPVSGNASACERAQEPSDHPKSTRLRVAVSQNPPVPAELQRFLEQHRPPQFETANGSRTNPKRPLSRVSFKDGLVYEGQLRRHDIMPLGWGRVTLPEGATYKGGWSGGRVHGKGALRLPNGNAYWGS